MSGPRAVIVTGGTGALGRELVALLLERGARVAIPWRREDPWKALQADLGHPDGLVGLEADLAAPAEARVFVDGAVARLGGLDGVALAAGAWAGGTTLEEAPEGEWDRMLASNLSSVATLCRAALPHLLGGGGSVVTVGAQAALAGGAKMAAYAVAKSAVHTLTRVLALENGHRGVRFNCVLPGTIDTPANRSAMPDADHAAWTSPAAIARVMVFLLSAESAAVNGALVPLDGTA